MEEMNIKDIKTQSQLRELGDIWHQRSFKLREIINDETTSQARRIKAYKLWLKLFRRISLMMEILAKANQINPKFKGEKAGVIISGSVHGLLLNEEEICRAT